MVTYITAQYRHVVVCSGLYPVRSQSLHGGYSSGCIESAMQPSSTEKSSRTTLHYVIQNDSARDLVLPPGPPPLDKTDCLTPLRACAHGVKIIVIHGIYIAIAVSTVNQLSLLCPEIL